jgi:hypothetical protein
MLAWVDQLVADLSSLGREEILLGMDNHGAQQTEAFKQKLQQVNATPANTPPGSIVLCYSISM